MTPQLTPRKKLEGDHFISFVTPNLFFITPGLSFRHPRESEVQMSHLLVGHPTRQRDPWMPDQVGHDSQGRPTSVDCYFVCEPCLAMAETA